MTDVPRSPNSQTDPRPTRFDLFISYAHRDNEGDFAGRVTALVEAIRAEHKSFTPDPLNIFFDVEAIADMADWEHRIYRGLRESKVMLAVLSPSYFGSAYCRKEWERYLELELQYALPGDEGAIAPIYVVTHPAFESNVDQLLDDWLKNLKRRQYLDVRPWWPEGRAALQRDDVRQRMQKLEQTLWLRICAVNAQAASQKNLIDRNQKFVGRTDELRRLRENLAFKRLTAITALHGIGGIGKSALANEYAYRYAAEYPGGRYQIGMETLVGPDAPALLRSQVVDLAVGYLGLQLAEDERRDARRAFLRAKALFEAAPLSLLILDNLNDAGLLSPSVRAQCLPAADKVHVIATTRLARDQLGDVVCQELDRLAPDDGFALLLKWRPLPEATANDDEWKAARHVVALLDGHALALDVAGAYLFRHPEKSFADLARYLESRGLAAAMTVVGRDVAARHDVIHPEKLLEPLLAPTLASLSPLERRILELAALLPADQIAVPWLRDALAEEFPELVTAVQPDDFAPDPWLTAVRRLVGLRLLVLHAAGDYRLSRMHRVVQSVVDAGRPPPQRAADEERLEQVAYPRGQQVSEHWGPAVVWEVAPLEAFANARFADETARIAWIMANVSHSLLKLGYTEAAGRFIERSFQIRVRLARELPDDVTAQRELSLSYGMLAWSSRIEGNPTEVWRQLYAQGLEISERLGHTLPDDFRAQLDLSKWYGIFVDVCHAEGNPTEARRFCTQGLEISERLVHTLPGNVTALRELSKWRGKLADLSLAEGNTTEARRLLTRCLDIQHRLAHTSPDDVEVQRDLTISYSRLANLSLAEGNPTEARWFFTQGLEIIARLAHSLPDDVVSQRDLSISLKKLADLSRAEGNPTEARRYYTQCLEIIEKLSRKESKMVGIHRELVSCYSILSDLAGQGGDTEMEQQYSEACYRQLRTMRERGMPLDGPLQQVWRQLQARFGTNP